MEKREKIMRNLNTNRTGYDKGKGEQKNILKERMCGLSSMGPANK
jgi:hypothetical protein